MKKIFLIIFIFSLLIIPVIFSSPTGTLTLLDQDTIASSATDFDLTGIKNYDTVDNGFLIGVNDTEVYALVSYQDVAVNASANQLFIIDANGGILGCTYDENEITCWDTGYDDDNYYGCAYGNGIIFAFRDNTIEAWNFTGSPPSFNEIDTNDSEIAEGYFITADNNNNVFAAEDDIINYWNYSQKNLYMGVPKPIVFQDRYDSRTDNFNGLYCNGTHLFVCGNYAIRVFNYSSYKLVNVSYFHDTDTGDGGYNYEGIFYDNNILYSIATKDTDLGCNSTLTAYSFDGWNLAVLDNLTLEDINFKEIYGNLDDTGRIVISYTTENTYYVGDGEYFGNGIMIYDFDGVTFTFVESRQDFYPFGYFNDIITDGNLTFVTKAITGLDMFSYYHNQQTIYPGLYVTAAASGLIKYNHTTSTLTTEYSIDPAPYVISVCTDSNGTIHVGENNGVIYAYDDTGTSLIDQGYSIDLGSFNVTDIESYKNRIYAIGDNSKAYILLYDITNKNGNYTLLSTFDDGIQFNDIYVYKTNLYATTDTCIRAFDVTNDTFLPVGYYNISNPEWSNIYNAAYANNKIVFVGTDNSVIALNFTKSTNFTYINHFNITYSSPSNHVYDMMMYDNDELFIAGNQNFYSLYWNGTILLEITNTSSVITKYDNIWTDNTYAFLLGRYDGPYNLFMYGYESFIYPDPPYNLSFTYNTVNDNLNFSWDRGNGSDREIVISKSGGFPTSPTDGTVVQNDTIQYYNTTTDSWIYYTIWSYDETNKLYSQTGLDVNWGLVQLSCFNESNPSQGIDFDVEISNSDTSQVYTADSCHNIHYIPITDIPYGENTIFVIRNSSYKFRTYYKNIQLSSYYDFIFYLPPLKTTVPPGSGDDGSNSTDTILCLISIVDDIQRPIPNVKTIVSRYINTTDTYNEVGSFYTDGNGQISLYLVPNGLYYFNCTKNGYIQIGSKFWIPTSLLYTKTFMLNLEAQNEINESSYDEEIIFNGYLHSNNSLIVNFTDLMDMTISTIIRVYETNNSNNITSLFYVDTRSGDSSFQLVIPGGNISNTYQVYLYLNHTVFGNVIDFFIIEHKTTITNDTNVNEKFENIFGGNLFSWTGLIGFFVLIACIFSFSKRNIGVGLIITGGVMLFIGSIIGIALLEIPISILFIICGILVQWRVSQMEVGG